MRFDEVQARTRDCSFILEMGNSSPIAWPIGIFVTSELRLSSIRQRLLAFAPRVIVSRHGAQLGIASII